MNDMSGTWNYAAVREISENFTVPCWEWSPWQFVL